jgi:hypothetical protein
LEIELKKTISVIPTGANGNIGHTGPGWRLAEIELSISEKVRSTLIQSNMDPSSQMFSPSQYKIVSQKKSFVLQKKCLFSEELNRKLKGGVESNVALTSENKLNKTKKIAETRRAMTDRRARGGQGMMAARPRWLATGQRPRGRRVPAGEPLLRGVIPRKNKGREEVGEGGSKKKRRMRWHRWKRPRNGEEEEGLFKAKAGARTPSSSINLLLFAAKSPLWPALP